MTTPQNPLHNAVTQCLIESADMIGRNTLVLRRLKEIWPNRSIEEILASDAGAVTYLAIQSGDVAIVEKEKA